MDRRATHDRRPRRPPGPRRRPRCSPVRSPATMLGDFGADVIKVEHPKARPGRAATARARTASGCGEGGQPQQARRSRSTSARPRAQDVFRRLVADADVVIENFRPGTLERWGLGPDELSAVNPRLVLARVTGFGQFGPYAAAPGFGTLAEAMSGFAAITGEPDGPPTLPPFGLADGIAALAAAFAIDDRPARPRDARGAGPGHRPRHHRADPDAARAAADGCTTARPVQQRTGNRSANNAPRNTYRTARRPLGGGLDQRAEHRRAGHAARRPPGADRRAVVRLRRRAGRARRRARRGGRRAGSPRARPRRGGPGLRGGAGGGRPDLRRPRRRSPTRSSRRWAPGHAVADPELGSVLMQNVLFRLSETPGRDPQRRPAASGSTPRRCWPSSASTPTRVAELRRKGAV